MKKGSDWTELQKQFQRYRQGESNVATSLFQALQNAVYGFLWIRLRSDEDTKDLTQVVLLKIHFARDRFDDSLSLKTWVFTIARRCLIDHWRGASEEDFIGPVEPGDDDAISQDFEIKDDLITIDQRFQLNHDLKKALEILKPTDRMIIFLYGVEGMSMSEIAETLDLTESAVKLRAHRSYQLLRPLLSWVTLMFFWNNKGWMGWN